MTGPTGGAGPARPGNPQRQVDGGVQFRLPRSEIILISSGVNQRIRRGYPYRSQARPRGSTCASRSPSWTTRRPWPPRHGQFPGVVFAIAVRKVRGQVHRRRCQGFLGQVVDGDGRAIIGSTRPAVRPGSKMVTGTDTRRRPADIDGALRLTLHVHDHAGADAEIRRHLAFQVGAGLMDVCIADIGSQPGGGAAAGRGDQPPFLA